MERRRERVIEELEIRAALIAVAPGVMLVSAPTVLFMRTPRFIVLALAPAQWLEGHAGHVQIACADIADGEPLVGPPSEFDATKLSRARDCERAGWSIAEDFDEPWPAGIVARDRQGGGLRAKACRLKTNLHLCGASGTDDER